MTDTTIVPEAVPATKTSAPRKKRTAATKAPPTVKKTNADVLLKLIRPGDHWGVRCFMYVVTQLKYSAPITSALVGLGSWLTHHFH
jgi:hypothetical protein